jgi:hypothetical protein
MITSFAPGKKIVAAAFDHIDKFDYYFLTPKNLKKIATLLGMLVSQNLDLAFRNVLSTQTAQNLIDIISQFHGMNS